MKVLHLNDHYQLVGGAETILFNTLDALEERGVTNVVVHHHPAGSDGNHRRAYLVAGIGDPYSRLSLTAAETFRAILHDERPDLIHIYDIGNPEISQISLRYAPTIVSVFNHSFYCPGGAKYLPLLGRICERKLGKGCLVSAFLTHCNSVRPRVLVSSYQNSRRMMEARRGLSFATLSKYQEKALLQNGCAPNAVKVLPPFTKLPALSEQEKYSNKHTLLFTGRVMPQKGLDHLLRCLKHVTSPFRLIVNGDGSSLEGAQKLARELGLADKVEFAGWTSGEENFDYYRQASIVVVPSIWPEPFGMVGIEAMSYGKPVVAFNVGGIPDWLADNVTGFLIPPYDMEKMADKIDYLLEHPDIASAMGLNGRKRVEEEFNKSIYTEKLMEIYQEALTNRV